MRWRGKWLGIGYQEFEANSMRETFKLKSYRDCIMQGKGVRDVGLEGRKGP